MTNVRRFTNPDVKPMSIDWIKKANEKVGQSWFAKETARFYSLRVSSDVFDGEDLAYFTTSEKQNADSARRYTVRSFDYETGIITTVGKIGELNNLYAIKRRASYYAERDYNAAR